jgi:N-terminal acetyltransferase B complex non-catalytic subunit
MAYSLTLPLAERMIAKMDKEGQMEQEQETRLYLMVLELQQKYKEALDVIEGPLGQKLEATTAFLDYIVNTKLTYLKKLDHWDQVNGLSKDILQKNPDQWNVYLDYITSIFRLVDDSENVKKNLPENVDKSVADAVNFISFQKENNSMCRGPFLAQIELHSRLLARRDKDAKIGNFAFQRFKI